MKATLIFLLFIVQSLCYAQLASWNNGSFKELDKKSSNNLKMWNEGNQFNYEEVSRNQNANGEVEVILNDLNGRSGMQVRLTNNTSYWKYQKDANWIVLYVGSWSVKPSFDASQKTLASWNNGSFKELDKNSGNNLKMWNEGNQFNYEEVSRNQNANGEVEVLLNDLNGRSGMQVRLTNNTSYWKYQKDANWIVLYAGSWSVKPSFDSIPVLSNSTINSAPQSKMLSIPIYHDVSYDNGFWVLATTKQKITGIVDWGQYPKSQTTFKDGIKDGKEQGWYGGDEKSQLKYERNYISGKLIGWQRFYSESGKLIGESNLIDGNGSIRVKYENGNLKWEENYINGLSHGSHKEWLENGTLIWESFWKNGKEEGLWRQWFEDGKLSYESNYKDGNVIVSRNWHPNGKIAYESNYKDGNVIVSRSWHPNGKRKYEAYFNNDQIISEKCWDINGKVDNCPSDY